MEILEVDNKSALQLPPSLTVAVAVNGSRKSTYALKWALERFATAAVGRLLIQFLHVRGRITAVPTPMGNYLPISQVRDDVVAAYKKEMEWKTSNMLFPYQQLCNEKKVKVEVVIIEEDDVPLAISEEVSRRKISKLVIGASSCGRFSRKFIGQTVSSKISKCTPSSCTVYVVSKGKLSSVRPSTSETGGSMKDGNDDTSSSPNSCMSYNSCSQSDQGSIASYSHFHPSSLVAQRFAVLSTINKNLIKKTSSSNTYLSGCTSMDIEDKEDAMSSFSNNSDIQCAGSRVASFRSLQTDWQSENSDQASMPNVPPDSSLECQVDINFELEKLRIELRHARGMYAMAQKETIDASRQLRNLSELRMEESIKLEDINLREERARELAMLEKEKYEAAKREAEFVRELAEREALRRKEVESKAKGDAKEIEKLEEVLESPDVQYKKFKWEDIVSATSSFSDEFKIGMGAYGTVYSCNFHHIKVAVKVLHAKEAHRTKQFQQELEILSTIRHPHLLLLLGACPDHGCLVYEFMENGSLEDRLLQKNNTIPIPWFVRFRIAWEVASALNFLHNSKPNSIVHRDLKPANILLDHNFVSKIGDVGLSTLLPSPNMLSKSTVLKDSRLVGTPCYIDPEYQRSGSVSSKSDVYAFGMVILRLLTAKPALALVHTVETALENSNLPEILDSSAGNWPIKETLELAILGLRCIEMKRRDRPDLNSEVLPVLERLKQMADVAALDMVPDVQSAPAKHFLCPILKDVMEDPCVAADGFTYDRKAMELWLKKNGKSPVTNLPLPNKNLISDYMLLSAIMEWKSQKN